MTTSNNCGRMRNDTKECETSRRNEANNTLMALIDKKRKKERKKEREQEGERERERERKREKCR